MAVAVPDYIRLSPYVDLRASEHLESDLRRIEKREGFRYNTMAPTPDIRFLGDIPVKTYGDRGMGNSTTLITTKSPPNATIINLFRKNAQYTQVDGAFGYTNFLTIGEYATMFQYLNSSMNVNGDESYWDYFLRASPLMMSSKDLIHRMAIVRCAFGVIGGAYHQLSMFMTGEPWSTLTSSQWLVQGKFKAFTSLDPLLAEARSLLSQLPVIPKYPKPSRLVYDRVVTRSPSMVVTNYLSEVMPENAMLLSVYVYTYWRLKFDAETLAALLIPPLYNQWRDAIGENALHTSQGYPMLLKAWGEVDPPKPFLNVQVPYDSNYANEEFCSLRVLVPTEVDATWMQKIRHECDHQHFTGAIEDFSPMATYLSRIGKNPLSNIVETIKGLQWPLTQANYMTDATRILNVYMYYVRMVEHKSNQFQKPYAEWAWNKDGRTKKEEEDLAIGQGRVEDATQTELILAKGWLRPWLLDEKNFTEYITTIYPEPRLRPIKGGENSDRYKTLCDKSQGGYRAWLAECIDKRKKLCPTSQGGYPITASMGVVKGFGSKYVEVFNFYPDYGVWATDQRGGWDSFVNYILNPYKETYGTTLLEDIIAQGDLIMGFVFKQLDTAGSVLSQYLPLIAVTGGILVLSINGVARIMNK